MKRLQRVVWGVLAVVSLTGCELILSYAIQKAAEGSTVTPVGDGTLMVKYQGPLPDEKKWLEASRKACPGGDFTILNHQPVGNPKGIQSYIGQIRCGTQPASPAQPPATEPGAPK